RRSSLEHVRRALPRFAGRLLRSQWVDARAPGLWGALLDNPPERWRRLIERAGLEKAASDDPVPGVLIDAMDHLDLEPLIETLRHVPVRESIHIEERLKVARQALADTLTG